MADMLCKSPITPKKCWSEAQPKARQGVDVDSGPMGHHLAQLCLAPVTEQGDAEPTGDLESRFLNKGHFQGLETAEAGEAVCRRSAKKKRNSTTRRV